MHKRTISLRTIGFATCILVASALAASSVGAQVVPAQTFTSAGTDASPQISSNCNTGVLQVSGTGSWTIVPQGSNDNGLTYSTITTINSGSITSSGTFSGAVAGFAASFFRFTVTAVSGSVTIVKSCTSQQLPGSGGGGGGGSYTAPPVQAVAPAASASPFPVYASLGFNATSNVAVAAGASSGTIVPYSSSAHHLYSITVAPFSAGTATSVVTITDGASGPLLAEIPANFAGGDIGFIAPRAFSTSIYANTTSGSPAFTVGYGL